MKLHKFAMILALAGILFPALYFATEPEVTSASLNPESSGLIDWDD